MSFSCHQPSKIIQSLIKKHIPEVNLLELSPCVIPPSVTGPLTLKPFSLSSPRLPPLTCARCVLQAASLPKGREGLAFGPGASGHRGQVGGHVPGSRGSAPLGWENESWVSQGCRRQSERQRATDREGQENRSSTGEEREICSTDAGSLREFDCSQRKCVYLCVLVCVCVCYVPVSRDFQTGWSSVELQSIPLQRNRPRPPLQNAPVPALQQLQHWWRLGLLWGGSPPSPPPPPPLTPPAMRKHACTNAHRAQKHTVAVRSSAVAMTTTNLCVG